MPDLLKAAVFVASQCALVGIIFSPLILRDRAPTRWSAAGSRSGLRLCAYFLPMTAVVAAALVNISRVGLDGGTGGKGLFAEVMAGHPAHIRLNPSACLVFELGSIVCGTDYVAVYNRDGNSWTISGIENGSGARFTGTARNAEPVPGALSIWGLLARFDANGTINYAGQVVGQLTIDPGSAAAVPAAATAGEAATAPGISSAALPLEPSLRERAFLGDPVVFALDVKSCAKRDWGDLTCGADYEARYAPATNQWTVSGPQSRDGRTVSNTRDNAKPNPGYIAAWGLELTFDNRGNLYLGTDRVGTVRLK